MKIVFGKIIFFPFFFCYIAAYRQEPSKRVIAPLLGFPITQIDLWGGRAVLALRDNNGVFPAELEAESHMWITQVASELHISTKKGLKNDKEVELFKWKQCNVTPTNSGVHEDTGMQSRGGPNDMSGLQTGVCGGLCLIGKARELKEDCHGCP